MQEPCRVQLSPSTNLQTMCWALLGCQAPPCHNIHWICNRNVEVEQFGVGLQLAAAKHAQAQLVYVLAAVNGCFNLLGMYSGRLRSCERTTPVVRWLICLVCLPGTTARPPSRWPTATCMAYSNLLPPKCPPAAHAAQ